MNSEKPAEDIAEYLRTPKDMASYLDVTLEENPRNVSAVAKALGDIARAHGMSAIAEQFGMSRTSLYKTLSADGKPSLETALRVCKAAGIRLRAETRD